MENDDIFLIKNILKKDTTGGKGNGILLADFVKKVFVAVADFFKSLAGSMILDLINQIQVTPFIQRLLPSHTKLEWYGGLKFKFI